MKRKLGWDKFINGETVDQDYIKNFKGWNSLTVSNTTIHGTSDISARQEINVNSEFWASNTSEVHIYPSETFMDCDSITGLMRAAGGSSSTGQSERNTQKEIEINFSENKKPGIGIIPNPNAGAFVLEIYNSEDGTASVSIKNPLGNELKKFNTMQEKISIDLHNLSKGIYFIEVMIENNIINKKVIIN